MMAIIPVGLLLASSLSAQAEPYLSPSGVSFPAWSRHALFKGAHYLPQPSLDENAVFW
jgi:hypothetical protein